MINDKIECCSFDYEVRSERIDFTLKLLIKSSNPYKMF
jgi:hypothetical protein